jgi:exopolysaccharide production protein ExoZ
MITNIQGLRFLAALAVCVMHVGLIKLDPDLFNMGGAGVDLFFVISGFIMVVSSQRLFGQPGAIGTFLYQRITRIVPLYWIATLVFLGLLLGFHSISLNPPTPDVYERTIAGFFFFPINSPTWWPLLVPGWSLNCEMFFYFLFAATIRFRQSIALVGVCTLICAFVVLGHMKIIHNFGIEDFWLKGMLLEFIWGILAAFLYLRWKPHPMIAAISLVAGTIMLARSSSFVDREFFLGLPAALIVLGATCVPQIPAKSPFGPSSFC